MDYLEFIARVTAHIPDKGQATMRYHGLYANAIFIDHLKVTFYKCRSRRVIDIAVRPEVYRQPRGDVNRLHLALVRNV